MRSPVRNVWSRSSTSLVRSAAPFGIRARDENRRHVADIGGEPRRGEVRDRGPRRDEHFAAHVAAFFFARELILEMHAGRAGFDHRLDQFEDVKRTAETGFRIGDDGQRTNRCSLSPSEWAI